MAPFRKDIGSTKGTTTTSDGSNGQGVYRDVVIVGAGFAGIYLLHRLRDELGLSCVVFEAGKELGGVWYWNRYPGARVDSEVPVYEYSFEKVWKDWTWTEKYPDRNELREYFAHVDKVVDVKKDVVFDARVVHTQFHKNPGTKSGKWTTKTEDGQVVYSRYLIIATGFATKRLFPDWPGLESFKGEIHHGSFWPKEGVDIKGKRVAVIGTGATGVQIAQHTAKEAASVTVFQRTPNLALPMRQRLLKKEEQDRNKVDYPKLFKDRLGTFSGFPYDFVGRNAMDDTPEQREKFYEELWAAGGFHFWLGTYHDTLFDKESNRQAYDFWAKKTRARISDPRKRDILAPLDPPHAWGTKRPSLELDYYEQLDRPQNDVVDLKATSIADVTETGIKTSDGKHREFDVIALGTGFDSLNGGMKNMGLKDVNGVDLAEKWKTATSSYIGMTCAGFPNMFFLYGAHSPAPFTNGPSCIDVQGNWIFEAISKCYRESIEYLDPIPAAEEAWKRRVVNLSEKTLFPGTASWYTGANVPGKPIEHLNYTGGLQRYAEDCRQVLEAGFSGFDTGNVHCSSFACFDT